MFSSLFANILYPLLTTAVVVGIRLDLKDPLAPQAASIGSDLCVLALGALAAVINNPRLIAWWGPEATMNVAFSLALLDVFLVIMCEKIIESLWDERNQAQTNLAMGAFAISIAATINVVTYW